MSTDLITQIEEYFDQVEAHQSPVTTEEVNSRLGTVTATRPTRALNRRGLLVAAASAILVLLAGIIPLLFIGDETPTADTVAPTPNSTIAPPTSVPTSQAPEVDNTRPTGTTIPEPVTIIPPEALPPRTSTVLDPAQLPWRRPDLESVPGLGEVSDSIFLGPIRDQHLIVVEEGEGSIPDELLFTSNGAEYTWSANSSFVLESMTEGDVTFPATDATDVIVGADLLWLAAPRSETLYRSTDAVSWTTVEFTGDPPIAGVKSEFDQPIVRRGDTIVATLFSSVFVSTDDGNTFIELQPFGEVGGYRLVTAGATDEEFFAIAAHGEDRILIAHSNDGLSWVVEPEPVDLGISTADAYFGTVTGDDPSMFLVVDINGPHIFKYSRDGSEIRIDEVAALDADLIAQYGLIPPDDPVLAFISAHHWQGRFALRRESPNWLLFLSDNGVDWGAVVLGSVQDGGKPQFSNELLFTGGTQTQPLGDVLSLPEIVLN